MLVNMNNTDNYTKSDIENPIAFFEGFFPKEYIQKIIEYSNTQGIIVEEETIGTIEDGQDISNIRTLDESKPLREILVNEFIDSIPSLIEDEIEISINITNKILLKRETLEGQKRVIHHLFIRMADIIENKLEFIPYDIAQKSKIILTSFFQEINRLYPELADKKHDIYKHYLELPINIGENYSLKMREDKFKQLSKLLEMLKEDEYLEQNLDLNLFQKAFNGSFITENNLGVKWMKKIGGKTHIASLVEMIDLLKCNGYIANYKDAQLSRIFIKGYEKEYLVGIKNWSVARNSKKEKKKRTKEIFEDITNIINRF